MLHHCAIARMSVQSLHVASWSPRNSNTTNRNPANSTCLADGGLFGQNHNLNAVKRFTVNTLEDGCSNHSASSNTGQTGAPSCVLRGWRCPRSFGMLLGLRLALHRIPFPAHRPNFSMRHPAGQSRLCHVFLPYSFNVGGQIISCLLAALEPSACCARSWGPGTSPCDDGCFEG